MLAVNGSADLQDSEITEIVDTKVARLPAKVDGRRMERDGLIIVEGQEFVLPILASFDDRQ